MRARAAHCAGPDEDVGFGLDDGEGVGAVAVGHGCCSCCGYCVTMIYQSQSEICRAGMMDGTDLRGSSSVEEADLGC